jgi:alpha-tubulin suppressor-like RCC1 family protein
MTRRIMLAVASTIGVLLIVVQAASAGPQANHSCAVTSGGAVKCWGDNFAGAIGDGTTTDRSTPVQVSGLTSGATEVTTGALHTCAVVNGGAKCWGSNNIGKLGDGTTTNRLTPVDVVGLGSGVLQISAANNHTCALTTAGGVKCWGINGAGQLGDGNLPTASSTPVNVSGLGSGVVQISTGFAHTCALTTARAVKCWGLNSVGQLGDGTVVNRSTPVAVAGLDSGVVQISAGSNHTCVLMTTGTVKCWGDNVSGALGDGTITSRSTPVDVVGLGGVDQISAGDLHTCALTGGTAKCWGNNGSFQLGFITVNQNQLTPVDVPGLGGLVEISPAFRHTCALTGGGVKCWGADNFGQRGDGAMASGSPTPVDALGLGSGVTSLPEFFVPRATLIVVKQVVNDNGGTAAASDWTMTVTGGHATPASFPGAGVPGTTVTLDAGAYSVSESGPSGYSATASADCTGNITAGQTKTCTITDDDRPPPSGPCIVLSNTSVAISGTASTPSTTRHAESEHLTVHNCGDSAVHLNAHGTDASGPSGSWELRRDTSNASVCDLGVNVFRAELTLWLSGGQAATPLAKTDTPLVGADGTTPFALGAAADQELSTGVDLPCAGSVGLGDPMTTNVTLTAVAP